MSALLPRSPLSRLQWAINLWSWQSECVSALRLKEEDRMRSNAEMANFMASVNQTCLQLDLDSGHLRATTSSRIRSKWHNGQPNWAHGGIPNNLRQLLCNSLTCSKGPASCNVSFVQVYTSCWCCCCCCRAAVVPFLMLVQLISGNCFVAQHGKLAVHVSTCPFCGGGPCYLLLVYLDSH